MPMVAPAARPSGGGRYRAIRIDDDGSRATHAGVDLYADMGTAVTAPAAGVVRLAHSEYVDGFGKYGRVVVVRLDGGGELMVAHLERVTVAPGQRVKAGDTLGTVGDTEFTAKHPQKRFDDSKPHAHVELLPTGSYPVRKGTPRADPSALAFYKSPPMPEHKRPVAPKAETELFASVADVNARADKLLAQWSTLQNQALGPAVTPRPDIPKWLQSGIIGDRKRYREWITSPTFGMWGALVPQDLTIFDVNLSKSSDYAQLKRWYAKYSKRAAALAKALPPGEDLAQGARPVSLPRQTTVVENLESATKAAQSVGWALLVVGVGLGALALASKSSK